MRKARVSPPPPRRLTRRSCCVMSVFVFSLAHSSRPLPPPSLPPISEASKLFGAAAAAGVALAAATGLGRAGAELDVTAAGTATVAPTAVRATAAAGRGAPGRGAPGRGAPGRGAPGPALSPPSERLGTFGETAAMLGDPIGGDGRIPIGGDGRGPAPGGPGRMGGVPPGEAPAPARARMRAI